jgi:hypothetical protein
MKPGRQLPISSVVLSSQQIDMRSALYSANKNKERDNNPLVSDGTKLIPSVTRVFNKARPMFVYLQAYENEAEATEPLVLYATFIRISEKSYETPSLAVTEGLRPKSKSVPMGLAIPLDELSPGEYNCQVTVLDPINKRAAFWQAPIMLIE